MAPVPLKFVVSFSSQDERHPVDNLIAGDGFKRWLSNPKDKLGQIEAIFQLDKSCIITHIDVGSYWCANIEVQVGKSSWPQGIPFKTIVAAANLMTPLDCRNAKNFLKTRMFNADDFTEDSVSQEWDRIRVVCRQPFRKDVQFGLSFIRVKSSALSSNNNDNNRSPSIDKAKSNLKQRENSSPVPMTLTSVKHSGGDSVLQSPSEICKQLLKIDSRNRGSPRTSELRNRLLKIASTAEDGTPKHEALTRTAKLVLAAADQSPKFQPMVPSTAQPKSKLVSNTLDKRTDPSFEVETRKFLACLHLAAEDLESTTIADLRHRLERRKRRKLTKDEKKLFIEITTAFLCSQFDGKNKNGNQSNENSKEVASHETPNQSHDNNDTWLSKSMSLICTADQSSSTTTSGMFFNSPNHKFISRSPRTPVTNKSSPSTSSLFESVPWLYLSPDEDLPYLCDPAEIPCSDALEYTAEKSSGPSPSKTPKYTLSKNYPVEICSGSVMSTLENEQLLHLGTNNGSPNEKFKPAPVGKFPTPVGRMGLIRTPVYGLKGKTLASARKKIDTGKTGTKITAGTPAKDTLAGFVSILCTGCHKMVPEPNIVLHQTRCRPGPSPSRTVEVLSDSDRETSPTVQGGQLQDNNHCWSETQTSFKVSALEDVQMVQCPICMLDFPSERINIHANVCMDVSILL